MFFLPLDKLSHTVKFSYLWIPEHSMQSSTPRLMEAQQGAVWLQSQHSSLPGRLCTLWRRLSPPPRAPLSALSPLSLGSLAESMLLVEGDAVRSKRCRDSWPGQKFWSYMELPCDCCYMRICVCVFIPQCNNCQRCLCKQRRCLPGLPGSTPAAASQTQPAAYSSYRFVDAGYMIPTRTHTRLMLESYMLVGWLVNSKFRYSQIWYK